MGCSTLHIKTEIECRVFLFDEEKGVAIPGTYFNLEVRKGEQDLLFVSVKDEALRCQMLYNVEENDCDYRIILEKSEFKQSSKDFGKRTLPPYYLFFDTETTGIPRDYNAPASDTRNWPRLVQLGWILTDINGNTLHQGNEIVMPDGFVIPTDAANVHGITTEKAMRVGKPLREVIDIFLNDVKQAKCLVGHNISFDQHVVGAELYRLLLRDIVSHKQSICTMQSTVDFCKIPGYNGYKYPKLQELYYKLFGSNFEDAHDAMADITATKRCFFELLRLGEIGYVNKNFDFKNAELVGEWGLNEIYESKEKMKCRQDPSGQYYLLWEPKDSGLEMTYAGSASDGSGRKPDYYKDSLVVYQSNNVADVGTANEFAFIYRCASECGDDCDD